MNEAVITDRLREYIVENFLYTHGDYRLGDDDALLAKGIIDSMGVMEVIAFLEEEFGVVVPDQDVTIDNLGSIRRIASYVVAARAPSSAAPDAVLLAS
jgi:acyl carrier protein